MSIEEFKKHIENDDFVEWEEVYKNHYYGTLKSEIERIWKKGKNVIFDVDVKGGLSLSKYFGEKAITIFIVPPNKAVLEERLRKRASDSEEDIQNRLAKADDELAYSKYFDTIIVNDDLATAQQEAYKYVKSFLKI